MGDDLKERPNGTLRVVALVLGLVTALIAFGDTCGIFKKGVGEPAARAEECRGGQLRTMGAGANGGICTQKCATADSCGSDLRCLDGACAPKATKRLGERCTAHWDCEGGRCVFPVALRDTLAGRRGPGFICTQPCGVGESCPSGYHCSMSMDENGATCWPDAARGRGDGDAGVP